MRALTVRPIFGTVAVSYAGVRDMFASSREVAVKRFKSLERKLAADRKLKLLYINFMHEYITFGHMSVASSPGAYYIPITPCTTLTLTIESYV